MIIVVLTLRVRYCALLDCESFIHVDFVFGTHAVSYEWNKEVFDYP